MQPQIPPASARQPHVRRQPAALPLWFVFGVAAVALIASVVVGVLVFSAVRSAFAGLTGPGGPIIPIFQPAATPGGPTPVTTPEGGWKCEGYTDRVTVLVMGIDQRVGDKNDVGPYRTDTMLLASVDPVNQTAFILSIPRDLWVTIPDYGYGRVSNRINTANVYGDAYGYPGGGPALAVKTVQLNLGIPVHHYVRLNFTAFEDFVDRIGGIDIVVPEDIYDPQYPTPDYGVEVFQISAGPHHLDGPTALKYARTRHTSGSDFDRARRQQQVILAIRDKVANLNKLPELIAQAPELYSIFSRSVQTDLSLNQIICLAQIAQGVPREQIRSAVVDQNYTTNWTTPDGAQVLVPDRQKLGALMLALYATPATVVPTATPDASAQIALEAARVVVENGTLTAGLASSTAEYLRGLGINVVDATNADRFDYSETLVIDYTGKPYTTRYLAALFNVRPANVLSGANPQSPVDVKVILGADAKLP